MEKEVFYGDGELTNYGTQLYMELLDALLQKNHTKKKYNTIERAITEFSIDDDGKRFIWREVLCRLENIKPQYIEEKIAEISKDAIIDSMTQYHTIPQSIKNVFTKHIELWKDIPLNNAQYMFTEITYDLFVKYWAFDRKIMREVKDAQKHNEIQYIIEIIAQHFSFIENYTKEQKDSLFTAYALL